MESSISNKKLLKQIKSAQFWRLIEFAAFLIAAFITGITAERGMVSESISWIPIMSLFAIVFIVWVEHVYYMRTKFLILNQEELKKQKRRLENKNGSTTRN